MTVPVGAVERPGVILLLVDNTMSGPLSTEISRLEKDLIGDGWTVRTHLISRSATPQSVKTLIVSEYRANPSQVKSVFLLGHIPVQLSGRLAPDGHLNIARAAGADAFYGDIDGQWTDAWNGTINGAVYVAGDGIFDQTLIPSAAELRVGRVDFWNLPEFQLSETELLRQYLNKDHRYRHKIDVLPETALFWKKDDIGGDALPDLQGVFGDQNVARATYMTLRVNGHRFAFGAARSTNFQSNPPVTPSDAITPADFDGKDLKTNFHWILGSYTWSWLENAEQVPGIAKFGLRDLLAGNKYGLTSFWGFGSDWNLRPLSAGDDFGEVQRVSINERRWIHLALMGDPSLRVHPVKPPANVTAVQDTNGISFSWAASTDQNIEGYYLYRSADEKGPFQRVGGLLTQTRASDATPPAGRLHYMVRAVQRKANPDGTTYTNHSQGTFVSVVYNPPWTNTNFASQTGSFTAEFDVTPLNNNLNGVFGISNGAADNFSDLAANLRFNISGAVDARNGAAYQAVSALTYSANKTYHVHMTVNVSNRRYSATVTPSGGSPVVIANDYAFRTEQAGVTALNNLAAHSANGTHVLANFKLGVVVPPPPPPPVIENKAPTVSLSSPAHGTTFVAPADITISGTASDADGTIAKVEFFQGTAKLGEDPTSPYSIKWINVPAGNYTLTARATDDDGARTTSNVVSIVVNSAPLPNPTPAAPSGLSAAAVSASQIHIAWSDNSSNESGFKIERKTGSGGTYAPIATVGAGVVSFNNTGLSAGTNYVYRVRAYNTAGHSAYSGEAGATTLQPPPPPPPPPVNKAPVADAGENIEVSIPSGAAFVEVVLDGSRSSDDGAIQKYLWTGTPDPSDEMRPAVRLANEETYVFTLHVVDNLDLVSAASHVLVTVKKAAGAVGRRRAPIKPFYLTKEPAVIIPCSSDVTIRTIQGREVQRLRCESGGQASWNGRSAAGPISAAGLYRVYEETGEESDEPRPLALIK